MPSYTPAIRVLLLCTGNQCRSPMAEVLARQHLAAADVDAVVESAGLLPGGRPASAHGVRVMSERGLDLAGHQSRRLEAAQLADADLILGMAREHITEAALLDPSTLARAFTLKDFVRRGEASPRRDGEDVRDWFARLAADRPRSELLRHGHDPQLDIADPIGRDIGRYRATASELDDLLARLAGLLARTEVRS